MYYIYTNIVADYHTKNREYTVLLVSSFRDVFRLIKLKYKQRRREIIGCLLFMYTECCLGYASLTDGNKQNKLQPVETYTIHGFAFRNIFV